MNRYQWLVFAVGFLLIGIYLGMLATTERSKCAEYWTGFDETSAIMFMGCESQAQVYAIPCMFSILLSIIFCICGFLEGSNRKT